MSEQDHALEEEMQEMDMLSLLASQSEVEESDDDEEDESDDVETLKERLSKRNKSLRKSKEAIHRIQDENKALLERLDKLEQRMSDGQSGNVDQANPEQKAQEWMDRVADNPVESIGYTDYKLSDLEQRMAGTVLPQLEELRSLISEIKGSTNPDVIENKKELAMLRNMPEFEGKSDAELLPFVKMMKGVRVKQPRGSVGGQRAKVDETKKFELSDEVKAQMGF